MRTIPPACSPRSARRRSGAVCGFLLLTPLAAGQAGDRQGEDQPDLPADLEIPPAPALSWEQELATFVVPDGLRVELVAAEPLVNDPVAAEFDEEGQLWVVEMTGFMPDVDGTDEAAPVGFIAVLRDADGDGRMDGRTVFMDGLVLPRSVYPCRGGALVILPNEVLFCRDTDGDGYADERELIDTYRGGIDSPEHALNGFVRTLDNWYRCANGPVKYRFLDGRWTVAATSGGGQWGITKDDLGRVYYDTNADPFRGDLFPSVYSLRNPNHGKIAGTNVRIAPDMTTWPARITPGVNRGYRTETLRDDFTLRTVTAVCGPHVYRGDALDRIGEPGPADVGDVFVPEPSGNLVKRYRLVPKGLGVEAVQAYQGREFLASTDERFRPVNACTGPDGALYVVDMYRGVLQHRVFVTSFLREQIIARGLEEPLGLGRIWRVVREDHVRPAPVRMGEWTWTQLVETLSHESGWMRDTAQRVIVDEWEQDEYALAALERLALEGESPLGRMHALWTLEGVDELDRSLLLAAMGDPDPRVAHAAVRVAEPYLSTGHPEPLEMALSVARSTDDPRLRHQCLLSLGAVRTEEGDAAIAELVSADCASGEQRSAALSGLRQRELGFLELLLARAEWAREEPGRAQLLRLLARCVAREGISARIGRIAELAADQPDAVAWRAGAMMRGLLDGRRKGPRGELRPLRLTQEPEAHARLLAWRSEAHGDLPQRLADGLVWPGKPGAPEEQVIRPLTDQERRWYASGQATYVGVCTACHQDSGLGEPGKAPALRGSPWVLGDRERLVRILVHGMRGELVIDGELWDMEMPALAATPEEIAGVATYVRREWGHGADPVPPELVRAVMAASDGRRDAWTVEELERLAE